jgi:hypothetical protein
MKCPFCKYEGKALFIDGTCPARTLPVWNEPGIILDLLDRLPESVWNDPDYLKQLEQRAEVDEVLNRYEKGHG